MEDQKSEEVIAFCQGLAFDFCISALPQKRCRFCFAKPLASGERLAPLVFRLRRSRAFGARSRAFGARYSRFALDTRDTRPSALDTRASRSILALRARHSRSALVAYFSRTTVNRVFDKRLRKSQPLKSRGSRNPLTQSKIISKNKRSFS